MKKLIPLSILLIFGCSLPDSSLKTIEKQAKKEITDFKIETQKHINCIEHCKAQGLLVTHFGNDCECREPIKNVLMSCAKACNSRMKLADSDKCECLNPYEPKVKSNATAQCHNNRDGTVSCP